MSGFTTDADVDALEPVAEELVVCVGERDPLGVEAVFRFADPRIIAAILAEKVILERDRAAHEERRRISEVREARRNANPDADDFAELLMKLRDSEAEVAELRQRVWGLPGGVKPAGMTIDRAEEIAARAEERRNDDHRWSELQGGRGTVTAGVEDRRVEQGQDESLVARQEPEGLGRLA